MSGKATYQELGPIHKEIDDMMFSVRLTQHSSLVTLLSALAHVGHASIGLFLSGVPTIFSALPFQIIAYPAAFHASTPPFSTMTFLKPCAWYFAA